MVGAIVVLTIICIFNIIMWAVFIGKFKKLFGADEVLSETRGILNEMLRDMNNNADRNITLLENKIQQLKAVSEEADKHILLLNKELQQRKMQDTFITQIEAHAPSSAKKAPRKNNSRLMNPAEVYLAEQKQGQLFDEAPQVQPETVEKTKKTTARKTASESRAKTVKAPVEESVQNIPNYTKSKDPVVPKKSLKQKIVELSKMGKSVSEIARELGCSVQEVKFSLEFS